MGCIIPAQSPFQTDSAFSVLTGNLSPIRRGYKSHGGIIDIVGMPGLGIIANKVVASVTHLSTCHSPCQNFGRSTGIPSYLTTGEDLTADLTQLCIAFSGEGETVIGLPRGMCQLTGKGNVGNLVTQAEINFLPCLTDSLKCHWGIKGNPADCQIRQLRG